MRVAWEIARSDVARWRRSPALIAATLIPAVAMSLTVFALTFAVGRQPVALAGSGPGPLAQRVLNILKDSDGFFLREVTPAQAARDLKQQRVAAVVKIPDDFDEEAAAHNAHLDVHINNVDLDFSDDIRRSVSEAVVEIDAPVLATLGEGPPLTRSERRIAARPNPYRVDVREHDLRKPDISYLDYQMIPVLALLALTAGALVTALSIAGDRESGTLRALALAPASRLAVVLGHLIGGTLAAIMLLLAVVVPLQFIGVLHPPPGRLPIVAVLLVATAIGSTGLGVIVGLLTRRVTTTVLAGVNVASASFLLGGGFTTIAFLPDAIQTIARATPTYYAVEGLREAMFYSEMPTLGRNLIVLLAAGLASVLIGAWLLSRSGRGTLWGRRTKAVPVPA
jgi:ABC-type multidrug transport system permease subunit